VSVGTPYAALPTIRLNRSAALVTAIAAVFVAFVALAPAHAYVHADGPATCATCHLTRHSPAVLASAPALAAEALIVSLPPTPAHHSSREVPLVTRSRGPPSPSSSSR
jgi:hypothetical protein